MPTPRRLTREQLAKFLPNHDAVRAFEQLFVQVSEVLPASDADLESLIGGAQKTNIDGITKRLDDLEAQRIGRPRGDRPAEEFANARPANLSSLIRRIEIIESFLGLPT